MPANGSIELEYRVQVMEGRLKRWAGAGHERHLMTRIWGSILHSRYRRVEKLKSEREMKCCAGGKFF